MLAIDKRDGFATNTVWPKKAFSATVFSLMRLIIQHLPHTILTF